MKQDDKQLVLQTDNPHTHPSSLRVLWDMDRLPVTDSHGAWGRQGSEEGEP